MQYPIEVIGYMLMGVLLLMSIIRTILFCRMNARRETIVHLENGKYNPSLKLAMDIAKVFGVSVEDCLSLQSPKNTKAERTAWCQCNQFGHS